MIHQAARASEELATATATAVPVTASVAAVAETEKGVAVGVSEVASVAETEEAVIDTGDTAFMITSTALVLAMTEPGLAYFYGGLVGRSSVLSIFMTCFTLICVMSLLFMGVGYSMAFDSGNPIVGGLGTPHANTCCATFSLWPLHRNH